METKTPAMVKKKSSCMICQCVDKKGSIWSIKKINYCFNWPNAVTYLKNGSIYLIENLFGEEDSKHVHNANADTCKFRLTWTVKEFCPACHRNYCMNKKRNQLHLISLNSRSFESQLLVKIAGEEDLWKEEIKGMNINDSAFKRRNQSMINIVTSRKMKQRANIYTEKLRK